MLLVLSKGRVCDVSCIYMFVDMSSVASSGMRAAISGRSNLVRLIRAVTRAAAAVVYERGESLSICSTMFSGFAWRGSFISK